jgi:hypothetical protein
MLLAWEAAKREQRWQQETAAKATIDLNVISVITASKRP